MNFLLWKIRSKNLLKETKDLDGNSGDYCNATHDFLLRIAHTTALQNGMTLCIIGQIYKDISLGFQA